MIVGTFCAPHSIMWAFLLTVFQTFFVQFDLRQVLDVDQKNGLWFARVALDIYYISKSASWDPSEFNDIEYLTLPRGDIWSPDIGQCWFWLSCKQKKLKAKSFYSTKAWMRLCEQEKYFSNKS